MRIAILGSNSQIAKDLIVSFSADTSNKIYLYSRRPDEMKLWLNQKDLNFFEARSYDEFEKNDVNEFDSIINFVGSGNPATTVAIGASIMQITERYDNLALEYLVKFPNCRYIFISSGAAFCSKYDSPVNEESVAKIPLNNLQSQDWYGIAKLYAECKHRALSDKAIVDVRIFNYFSSSQDPHARYLITDILRAIKNGDVLETTPDEIVRDFITPPDFFQLIQKILGAPKVNIAIDCFSKSPVKKSQLLQSMAENFGLKYKSKSCGVAINATGAKPYYFSVNNSAAKQFKYEPSLTAMEGVLREACLILSK
jgi:nucleoside-diphosphate-sugar epimerase